MSTIRVCGEDRMCFTVDEDTLEPVGPSVYDPYCWTDPLPGEQIHVNEWSLRRAKQRAFTSTDHSGAKP